MVPVCYSTTWIKVPEHSVPIWSTGWKHRKLSRRSGTYLQLCSNISDIQKFHKAIGLLLSCYRGLLIKFSFYTFKTTMTPFLWACIKMCTVLCIYKGICSNLRKKLGNHSLKASTWNSKCKTLANIHRE